MRLLKEIFKRPVTICFTIILAIILGIISTTSMAVNLFPNMSFPYMSVVTTYVGASSEVIEADVTSVLEKSLSTVKGIHDIQTYSMDHVSAMILEFDYGVSLDEKEEDVSKKLASVTLPSDCGTPTVSRVNLNDTAVSTVTIFSSTDSIQNVYQDAEELQKQFLTIDGVQRVDILGAPTQQIEVSPIHGLESASLLLLQALSDGAYDIPLGSLEENGMSVSILNSSKPTTREEMENLPIQISFGSEYTSQFRQIQTTLDYLENVTTEDLDAFQTKAQDVLFGIQELESLTPEELDQMLQHLSTLEIVVRLASNYSAEELESLWNNGLRQLVESNLLKNMTDDELNTWAERLSIDVQLLIWLRGNGEISPDTGVSYAEEYYMQIVEFRRTYPNVWNDEDLAGLIYQMGFVSENEGDANYIAPADLAHFISLVRKTNTRELRTVLQHLQNGETVTDQEYARLFFGTTSGGIVTSQTISIIRSPDFTYNFDIFYAYKLLHQTTAEDGTITADPIPSEDWVMLYHQMKWETPLFPLPIEAELIDFIRPLSWSADGSVTLTLGQMAHIEVTNTYDSATYFGDSSVTSLQLLVYADDEGNSTKIVDTVEKKINDFSCSHSSSEIVMLDNQAEMIQDSLVNALTSLIIGGALAIVVIYLFLRKIPSSLIIAISMPLSILCTLLCLYLMGITLNMVSVGGLAVGIGMLVDNSIVVLESITSEREKGKSALEASLDGTRLVLGSLFGSTITSICVFIPILFMNGLTKEIFSDLAWAVMLSLSFSLLVAVLVIPTLYCLVYRNKKEEKKSESSLMEKIKRWYRNILSKVLHHRGLTLGISLGIFAASIGLAFTTGVEFLPSIDQKKVEVTLSYRAEDSFETCQNISLQAYNLLEETLDHVEHISMSVAKQGFFSNSLSGVITIQLDQSANTSKSSEQIRSILEGGGFASYHPSVTEMDGVVASVTGGMSGVSIVLHGEDFSLLKEAVQQIETKVEGKEGIRQVRDDVVENAVSYTLKIDKQKCMDYGIDYSLLIQTLRVGISGYEVSTIVEQGKETNVVVKFQENTFQNYYQNLAEYVVGFDANGNAVTLANTMEEDSAEHPYVGTLVRKVGPNAIKKSKGKYEVTISCETYGLDTGKATKILKSSTKEVLKNYSNITYSEGGVSYYLTDAFSGLVVALAISFFLLYGIMACLFESWKKPTIVLFSIPLSFTGGFLALAVTRVSLNVVSFIGLIMLMGVIVNDAIVLLERIQQLRESGYEDKEAVLEGCTQRLRAVWMTTLTTILALFPVALGLGKGGTLMQPLGVVALGGLLIGTFVTLVLIPTVYCLMYRIRFAPKKEKKKHE